MAVNENTLQRRSENLPTPDVNSSVNDRVRYLIQRLRKTQQQFANIVGIDGPSLSRILNGRAPFSDAILNRIVVNCGVSKEWLTKGVDVPFPRTVERHPDLYVDEDDCPRTLARDGNGVPVYDIDVTAGYSELSAMFTNDRIVGFLQMPKITPGSVIVRVSGDSMRPEIPDGSYIAIRPINLESAIYWGQNYLVILEDYRMVKVLRRHPDPDMVILHSNNPDYDDMEVKRSDIKALYLVEAVVQYTFLA